MSQTAIPVPAPGTATVESRSKTSPRTSYTFSIEKELFPGISQAQAQGNLHGSLLTKSHLPWSRFLQSVELMIVTRVTLRMALKRVSFASKGIFILLVKSKFQDIPESICRILYPQKLLKAFSRKYLPVLRF